MGEGRNLLSPHFIIMEIDGHEEITGEEIDWACDTRDNDPTGELQEEFRN